VSWSVAESYESHAAGWIHRVFLLEEEYRPLPAEPSPAMLVSRVSERLTLAAAAIEDLERLEEERELGEPEEDHFGARSLLDVAVFFLGAAGFALTAINCIAPDQIEASVTERKDAWLEKLDQDVLGTLETEQDFLDDASLDELLRMSLRALTEALQGVAELEGVNALTSDDYDEDDEGRDEPTVDELLLELEQSWERARVGEREEDETVEWREYLIERIVDSLWHTAMWSAVASDVLVERHEQNAPRRP
jgi:hypothetical protein